MLLSILRMHFAVLGCRVVSSLTLGLDGASAASPPAL
jgi:hypothetical protein